MNTTANIFRTFSVSLLSLVYLIIIYISLWICLPPYLFTKLNNILSLNKFIILGLLLIVLFLLWIKNNKLVVFGKLMLIISFAILIFYFIYSLIEGTTTIPPIHDFIFGLFFSIMIYLILTNFVNRENSYKFSNLIQILIIVSTVLSSIVGIFQMLPSMGKEMAELPGLFYVKNHFGIFTSMGFALSVTRLFLTTSFKRIIWLMISFILLIGVVLSMSRAAWLSSILILFYLAIYFNKKHLLILPALILIGILYIFWERIFDAAYLGDISTGRFLLWATFISHLFNYGNLFLGLGVGYTFKFNPMELVGFVGFQAADNPYIYVHNDFLYFLLETGIIGLLLFVLFYIVIFQDISKFLKNEKNNYKGIKIVLSVICSLIPIIMMHLTDTFLFASGLLHYLFFLLSSLYMVTDKYKIVK